MKTRTYTTRIQEGDYSPDDLALMLLRACSNNYVAAKKMLTRAKSKKPSRTSDDMIYLAAYNLFQKGRKGEDRYTDNGALKKLLGGRYRVYWDRLQKRDQTLKQIAQLVQNLPDKS